MKKENLSRKNIGLLGGWASILVNFFLFLLKGALGFLAGSVALIADAFHTLSDIATSLIVLISFYISEKPSDSEHPFGHGRAEFISAIVMATLLAVTAFELFKYSVERILNPVAFVAPWWIIGVVLGTILVKEGLAFFTMNLSRKIHSDTLKADSWHHHLDAASSLLVVIAFLFSHFQFPYLDGIVGAIIAVIILISAYGIAKSPIDNLLGKSPNIDLLNRIEKIVLSFPEVKGVHDIIIHTYGENTIISLHIEVDENLSLNQAHSISEKVDQELRRLLNAHITVHVDPVMERTPLYREIEDKVWSFCRNTPGCDSFHDLRVYKNGKKIKILLDLVESSDAQKGTEERLIRSFKNYIREQMPGICDITVKVEPKFSITRKSRHN